MRPIGLTAIVMSALFLASATMSPVLAATKVAAPAVTKEQRDKGKAAAPGLVSAGGLDCQVSDARLIGESKDAKTKKSSTFYELACANNEGVIVDQVSDGPPQVFTCEETAAPTADGKPNSLMCILPGNTDPKTGLLPYIAKAGVACTPDKVRALGHSATNTVYELACHNGDGYILEVSAPPRLDKPATMNPCIMYAETSNVKCELTDRAAQLAVADHLMAQSGKPCAIKDRSFMGVTPSGSRYFELACQDGKGYVVEQAANGAFVKVIDCAAADAIGGGCKLTDSRQAKTEQNSLYTRLARNAGFQCDVSGYAPFSVNIAGKEVVELACSNRPDGGIGVFATSGGGVVYDCAHSELESFRCSMSKPASAYGTLTADLRKLGKNTCAVSNERTVGLAADKTGYIEVACADGLPGYMIKYTIDPIRPTTAIVCAEAKGIAGGCVLPGNTKG